MTPRDAVTHILDRAADQAEARGGSAQLAARFAGGTRALSRELGVSQRTVQRWVKFEQGGGGEGRNVMRSPQRAPVAAMADAESQQEAIRELRGQPLSIDNAELEVSYAGQDEGTREVDDLEIDPTEMLDELEAGDPDAAAQALQTAILEAYGAPLALTIENMEFTPVFH